MICVRRLNGVEFALNPDLIQRVEGHPDTVITLIDDTKYIVAESVPQVIREIRDFRAGILHTAHLMDVGSYPAPDLDDDQPNHPRADLSPANAADSSVLPFPNREER